MAQNELTDMDPLASAKVDDDPEFEAVRSGNLRPYQVRNVDSRRRAYEWWMSERGGNAVQSNAQKASGLVNGGGGFIDQNAPSDLERVRSAQIRPDQIQNPAVRSGAYAMLRSDPQYAADFRANMRAATSGIGVPADPKDVARAEEDLRNGVGVPVPQRDYHAAVRAKIEGRNRQWDESRTARAARMIGRGDPRKWDEEIEKFNRRHAGESFLRREDIVQQSGRRDSPSFGQYGDAPQVIQPNPMQGPARDPSVIQTAYGDHRIQQINGKQMAVPVLSGPGGVTIPNAGMLSRSEFDDSVGARDAGAIKRMIYASGQPEWVSQMRKIDSGYAALDSDTLSSQEREVAETEIRNRENDLFYRWVRTNAGMIGGGEQGVPRGQQGMQEYESPDDRKQRIRDEETARREGEQNDRRTLTDRRRVIDRATEIKGDYPDMTDEDAIAAAEAEFGGNPGALYPRKSKERPEKPDFDADRFASSYRREFKRASELATQIRSEKIRQTYTPEQIADAEKRFNIPRTADIHKSALAQAFASAGGETADAGQHKKAVGEAFDSLAERFRSGEIDEETVRSRVRVEVLQHLPAFFDKIEAMSDAEGIDPSKTLDAVVAGFVRKVISAKGGEG